MRKDKLSESVRIFKFSTYQTNIEIPTACIPQFQEQPEKSGLKKI